jgi:hypothetical protein
MSDKKSPNQLVSAIMFGMMELTRLAEDLYKARTSKVESDSTTADSKTADSRTTDSRTTDSRTTDSRTTDSMTTDSMTTDSTLAGSHQASVDGFTSDTGASSDQPRLAYSGPIAATLVDPTSTMRPPVRHDDNTTTGSKATIEVGFRPSSVQTIF